MKRTKNNMKKILEYFGFFHVSILLDEVDKFDELRRKESQRLIFKSFVEGDRESAEKSMEEGYQGIGAMRFVNDFLEKRN